MELSEKAIEKGFVITYICEVWHFKEQTDELFQPYIKAFIKIKQEASEWPAECDTEEKKGTICKIMSNMKVFNWITIKWKRIQAYALWLN